MNLPTNVTAIFKNKYTYVALVFAIGVIWAVYSHFWVEATPEGVQSVEAKWNAAIRDLGVEPVYPPEEDIEVGDIFAIVSDDSLPETGLIDTPIANHAVRLWRMDLSKDIEDNYKNIYIFESANGTEQQKSKALQVVPDAGAPSIKDAVAPSIKIASLSPGADSIFKLNDYRVNLPIVTFPKFILSKSRSADTHDFFKLIGFGSDSQSGSKTEVSIKNTQTYGIPYLVAQRALVSFCKELFPPMCEDSAVRRVLSTRIGDQIYDIGKDKKTNQPKYRMTVELGLINRVFLTQNIETNLVRNQSSKVQGGHNIPREDKEKIAGMSVDEPAPKPKTSGPTTGALDDKLDSQFGSAEDESELAVAFDGKILDRPVVFGFESVRYSPPPAVIPVNTISTEKSK